MTEKEEVHCNTCGITVLMPKTFTKTLRKYNAGYSCLNKNHTIEDSVKLYAGSDIISLGGWKTKVIDEVFRRIELEMLISRKDIIDKKKLLHLKKELVGS